MDCGFASTDLPTTDRHIAVMWIDFDSAGATARTFRRDKNRPTAAKGIENEITAPRTIPDRIGNHRDRLDRRMALQFLQATTLERINAGIFPNISARSTVLTKLEIVEVLARGCISR